MAKRKARSQPAWTDIKEKLAGFDRRGLIGLIQDLYSAHKENRTFLHARFGVGSDALRPYKETLDRWLWPDVLRNQDTDFDGTEGAFAREKVEIFASPDAIRNSFYRIFLVGQSSAGVRRNGNWFGLEA